MRTFPFEQSMCWCCGSAVWTPGGIILIGVEEKKEKKEKKEREKKEKERERRTV